VQIVVERLDQADELVARVAESAGVAVSGMAGDDAAPLERLWRIKFERIGRHPIEDRPLNLIEQVNQTFTYLATFKALRLLFDWHPDAAPFVCNLGTSKGHDIEDERGGSVAAEIFCATSPRSNDKLRKDLDRMADSAALHRYVFFAAPGFAGGRQEQLERADGVQVWSIPTAELMTG
jgi:hypothetical protein